MLASVPDWSRLQPLDPARSRWKNSLRHMGCSPFVFSLYAWLGLPHQDHLLGRLSVRSWLVRLLMLKRAVAVRLMAEDGGLSITWRLMPTAWMW